LDENPAAGGFNQDAAQGGLVGAFFIEWVSAAKRAIQVDNVQPARTGFNPAASGGGWVSGILGLAVGVTFFQANDLPGAQVDGGKDGEGMNCLHEDQDLRK
jgi:hypothetical protein